MKRLKKINWHPVDELPLKEFKKLEKDIRFNSVHELFKKIKFSK